MNAWLKVGGSKFFEWFAPAQQFSDNYLTLSRAHVYMHHLFLPWLLVRGCLSIVF